VGEGIGVRVITGVGLGFTMKTTSETPLPFQSVTITGYSPTSRVVGTVAVIVLEFTNVACKGTLIVSARE
jgi:hypothetical protein